MKVESIKTSSDESKPQEEAILTEENKKQFDELLAKVEGRALRYQTNTEEIVALKRQLYDGGSNLTSHILDKIGVVLGGREDSLLQKNTRINDALHLIYYSAKPADSTKLGNLLLDEVVLRISDRSNKHDILEILRRLGTFDNVEQLKQYAIQSLDTQYNHSGSDWNRQDAFDAIFTLLCIRRRLVEGEEIAKLDQAIRCIKDEVKKRGHMPIEEDDIESLTELLDDDLEARFQRQFIQAEPVRPEFEDEGDNYDYYSGSGMSDWSEQDEYYDYGGQSRERGQTYSEESRVAIEKANYIALEDKDTAPTAISVIQLHMYNYLLNNPEATDDQVKNEHTKIKRLSEKEKEFSDIENPLPTIGIEIEIPEDILTGEKISVLNAFHIPNNSEINGLWEVNPHYSYSPAVQSRTIQELARMKAILLDKDSGRVTGEPLSLHVNFGMPKGINGFADQKVFQRLNDLLIYGFVSPRRIKARKTRSSFDVRIGAEPSKKADNLKSENGDHVSSNDFVRLEMRAGEFKDYPTFRMLAESQRLMAMFFSYIKKSRNFPLNPAEQQLADLWVVFEEKVIGFLKREVANSNLVDTDVQRALAVMESADFRARCRAYISEYSRYVANILKASNFAC